MMQEIAGIIILTTVYVCLAVIVFAPSLFAGWLYLISRKLPKTGTRFFRTFLTTLAVNLIVAVVLFRVAADYLLPVAVAGNDASAMESLATAVASQERRKAALGAYEAIGPVRGPYADDFGLVINKDVVLMVEPVWDGKHGRNTFLVFALHVWGSAVAVRDQDGTIGFKPGDSRDAEMLRGKLLRSVH
jgi:hypothetical protein